MLASKVSSAMRVILCVGVIGALFQLEMSHFIYQRELMGPEPWRWWTAHLVHVGWRHYGLNMLAFLCLPFIFPHGQRHSLIIALALLPLMVSAGLYVIFPHVQAYAGLSGILHGIFTMVAIESLRLKQERQFAMLILICIVIKISIEKWMGYSETAQLIGAPVLIESHQIGVISGIILALLYQSTCYLAEKLNLDKL